MSVPISKWCRATIRYFLETANITVKYVIASVMLIVFILVVACDDSMAKNEDIRPLPDGWSRVQVREGFAARDHEHALVGFTVDLPPGWSAGETWPFEGPSGWIAGSERDEHTLPLLLRFTIDIDLDERTAGYVNRSRYDISRPVIEGQEALFFLAEDESISYEIGAYFDHIPGAPEGVTAPSLRISGTNHRTENMETVRDVLMSIRYRALDNLPDLPKPRVERGIDWNTYVAETRQPRFTIDLPPGWEKIDAASFDSFAGRFEGDGIRIGFDYGNVVGVPYDPSIMVRNPEFDQPHVIWEEILDGNKVWLVKPVSPVPHEDGITGAYASAEDGFYGGSRQVELFAHGLNGGEQELALAILRTVVVMD